MKAFAKAFYESAAWRRTRAYILKRDAGLCVRCGAPGCIVHHKTELTPRNIDDPMITLNEDNLETVCRTCHAIIHEGTPPLADGLAFDADGNVIESAISPRCAAENFRRRNRASPTFRTAPVAHMRGGNAKFRRWHTLYGGRKKTYEDMSNPEKLTRKSGKLKNFSVIYPQKRSNSRRV